jgi:hypothetical protein
MVENTQRFLLASETAPVVSEHIFDDVELAFETEIPYCLLF